MLEVGDQSPIPVRQARPRRFPFVAEGCVHGVRERVQAPCAGRFEEPGDEPENFHSDLLPKKRDFVYILHMPELTIRAGICGFITVIRTSSADMQTVSIEFETTCAHAFKAREELRSVDAYAELFKKPYETSVHQALSKYLPQVTCPLYSGFLKAIEAAAGLALPRDVSMTFTPT